MTQILSRQNELTFTFTFLPNWLPGAVAVICQKVMVDDSEMIRTQMGNTEDQKMVAVARMLCKIPPLTVISNQ